MERRAVMRRDADRARERGLRSRFDELRSEIGAQIRDMKLIGGFALGCIMFGITIAGGVAAVGTALTIVRSWPENLEATNRTVAQNQAEIVQVLDSMDRRHSARMDALTELQTSAEVTRRYLLCRTDSPRAACERILFELADPSAPAP